jgi:hypothetical protein
MGTLIEQLATDRIQGPRLVLAYTIGGILGIAVAVGLLSAM